MRPNGTGGLLAACVGAATVVAACGGGAGGDSGETERPRGGSLVVTRSAVAGFLPAESLSGVGAFFAPPGPAATATAPEPGTCLWSTPYPAETPTPTPTPEVTWKDAGSHLVLRSSGSALELDRFEGPAGEILYLTRADAQAKTFETGVGYDLEIEGSESPSGIPGATLAGALAVPSPLGLYAPDFALTPVPLPRQPLQIGWTPGPPDGRVLVRVTISGSAGTSTLSCATEDDGFFEVSEASMAQFPGGGGTLTVSRTARTETKLSARTWMVAEGVLVEGGAVTLP